MTLPQLEPTLTPIDLEIPIRGGIKKKILVFFRKTPKGGGRGLAESEIFLSEKTEIFLEFFFERGGGPTYSKRVLS